MSDYAYPTAHDSLTDEVIFLFTRPCANKRKRTKLVCQRLETPEDPSSPISLNLTPSSPSTPPTDEPVSAFGDDFNNAIDNGLHHAIDDDLNNTLDHGRDPSWDLFHDYSNPYDGIIASSDIFDRRCARSASQNDGESLIDILNELDKNAAAQEEALQALILAVQANAASNKATRNLLAPREKHVIRALSILARMRPKEIATLMDLDTKDVYYVLAARPQPGYGNGGCPTAMTDHITKLVKALMATQRRTRRVDPKRMARRTPFHKAFRGTVSRLAPRSSDPNPIEEV
ncbi:hypothetical protein ACHAPA_005520 [Fusarium lateritium]